MPYFTPNALCNRFLQDRSTIIAECSDDSVVYHTKNGKEIRLKTNEIKYDGGLDSLKQDIYRSLSQDHEDNERTIFFVLFDKKHRISEIRMCSLLNKEPITPLPYADDYIRAIAKTFGILTD